MRTYQTLSLIGCLIGLFLMLGLFGVAGLGIFSNNMSLNLTKSYANNSETARQQASHDVYERNFNSFAAGTFFSLLLYIAGIVITFVVRRVKALGIILIVLGFIPILITIGWGIIPFALLLPAGIVALREKKQANNLVGE
jgi:ABC-type Fe3+ transport system permease subunit